jgi:formiminoglutamase
VTGYRPTLVEVAVPMRLGSISGGRFDLAPDAIRRSVDRFVAHAPGDPSRMRELSLTFEGTEDLNEVAAMAPADAFEPIRRAVGDALGGGGPGRAVVILGGDNSITRPGVHAVAARLERTGLLTLDAHHDLRDTGHGLTNGNPVRALLEDGLPGVNVVQVGIQPLANPAASPQVAEEAGITVVTAEEIGARGIRDVVRRALDHLDRVADAIYVDLDIDVLDRAFAPGAPGSRPGGLHPGELQAAARLCGAEPKVRAIDIVEMDPERDVAESTALAAAGCYLSFAAGLEARGVGSPPT